jgi:hypothetical protein
MRLGHLETGSARTWPEGGPKLLWKLENLGRGYSSVATVAGRVYTMGDREEPAAGRGGKLEGGGGCQMYVGCQPLKQGQKPLTSDL